VTERRCQTKKVQTKKKKKLQRSGIGNQIVPILSDLGPWIREMQI